MIHSVVIYKYQIYKISTFPKTKIINMSYYKKPSYKKSQSMYVLPFFIAPNNTVQVLIALKKVYSNKDGYIQNNPGQYVVVGGGGKGQTLDAKVADAFREFHEETGSKLDIKSVAGTKDFPGKMTAVLYRVQTEGEYNRLLRLNPNEKYKELELLQWVDLDRARWLFGNIKNNGPANGKKDEMIREYIPKLYVWEKNPWNIQYRAEFKTLKYSLDNLPYKVSAGQVFQDLGRHGDNSQFYSVITRFLGKYIDKRSKIDWFEDATDALVEYLQR